MDTLLNRARELAGRGPLGLLRGGPHTISPTAHYTGYVWARNGLSPEDLRTPEGWLLYHGLRPAMAASTALGGPTVESLLLARHQAIDHLLTGAIESGRIGQVIEIAAGMSPRGHRFARRYGERLTYVEADLPDMAERKRKILRRLGPPPTHQVVPIDALRDEGEASLASLAAALDADRGLAVVTEGLLNYLPPETVRELWARVATSLAPFPHGLYLSDLHLGSPGNKALEKAFTAGLSVFVRGKVHAHFADAPAAERTLLDAGFGAGSVRTPADVPGDLPATREPSAGYIHIVHATTRP